MVNLFGYRSILRRLNQLNIDWRAGVTVQTLCQDPYCPTVIRWVHNQLESKPTKIAMYDYKPKPSGCGNGGGGLERLIYIPSADKYLTELQILEMRRPGHSILTDETLPEETRVILAGGLREFVDETGFKDIEIRTDYPGVFLSDYMYPDWVDAKGVVHRGGHRRITLWGKLSSYREDPIVESDEIDWTDWFDMSMSLPKLFFNIAPDRPYVSHVRSTLGGILKIHRFERETSDSFVANIPGRIHPSWWYAFQVGKGDDRFPRGGYKLSPGEWYKLFHLMVAKRMEEADNDFLVKFLGYNLTNVKRIEEERMGWAESEDSSTAQKITQAVDDSEDSEGIPTVEDMVRKEDEEYRMWMEKELGIEPTN
ncbi:MAG: hypothetical protein HY505_01705 [Candidatus Yanofskybacteria bacterium]|nr:hypothetical protein [Candidatus Yanofskybacteria bacterium]